MQPLEVSANTVQCEQECLLNLLLFFFSCDQVEFHIAMLILVLVLAPSSWMMLYVLQVLVNYWNVLAGQFQVIIVLTLLMLALGVKVIF